MSDISLSKAVRSNLLSLQGTADMMAVAQNRLSTGNKVNSALDNPSNWFTAKGLTNRSSDLNALMDSMANGIQTLKAADNGLSAMTKTLESMQSTLRQARQDKSFQTASYTIGATTTGTLSLTGGALTGTSDIALTKAQPAQVTGGADFALAKTQGQANSTFAAADFDEATDTISFDLAVDGGVAKTVTITKAIADAASDGGDGNLSTGDEMRAALRLAITEAGFAAGAVTVGGTGTAIQLKSGTPGATSAVAVTNKAFVEGGTGTGTDLIASAGFGAFTAANTPAATATITIGDGTNATNNIVLSGDTHDTAEKAAKAINDAITAKNATLAAADDLPFTASVKDGRLVITGAADGTGADVVLGGAGVDAVFGTVAQRDTKLASTTGGATKTVDELVSEINAKTKADGTANELIGKIRASNDNGKLRIENQSTQKLDITGASSGALTGVATATSEIAGNSVRAGLADQFNELRDQLDKLADDASFNGINLMRGDKLTITFNETGTSSIDIQTKNGQTINASNLGVPTQLEEKQLDSDTDIDALLTDMKSALDDVRSQASTFGSNLSIVQNRQDFTKAMIDTLETGAGNLTLADMNEEAANLLALQTRQQLSSNSLSLASQADQSILQLLR